MILNPHRKIMTANPVQTTGLHGVKKGGNREGNPWGIEFLFPP